MNLTKFIDKKISLIEELEESDGEISPKTEGELEVINAQIRESVDDVVSYRQWLDSSIDKYKSLLKAFVARQESKKKRLDDFLTYAVKKTGDLKTPFSSIKIQSRKNKSILITNFDECAAAYPEAVTIKTMDNCRTIYISKEVLKFNSRDSEPIGFEFIESESNFISARQRVNIKGEINGITEREDQKSN